MANVGDYIKFGNYPQTANGDIQPIEWQVLAKEENKMLLISKYALESKCFDNDWVKNWKKSEIRQWLNGEFYNKAFNKNEKKYIRNSTISMNEKIDIYDFDENEKKFIRISTIYRYKEVGFLENLFGKQKCNDKVFLLNNEEIKKYFANYDERKCKATEYAKANGAYVDDDNSYSWWWLRSPQLDYNFNVYNISSYGCWDYNCIYFNSLLFRPALWINI